MRYARHQVPILCRLKHRKLNRRALFFAFLVSKKRGAFEKRREIFRALVLQNTKFYILLKLLTFKQQDELVRGIVDERVQLLSVYGHGAT